MRLVVKGICGLSFVLHSDDDAYVLELKSTIYENTGIEPIFMELVFKGDVLKDNNMISQYALKDGSTMYLALSIKLSEEKLQNIIQRIDVAATEQYLECDEVQNLIKNRPNMLSQNDIEEFLDENLEMLMNPEAIPEMSRLNDLALNQWEMSPRGFSELVQSFREVEAVENLFEDLAESGEFPTVIGEKPLNPSNDPLPIIFEHPSVLTSSDVPKSFTLSEKRGGVNHSGDYHHLI